MENHIMVDLETMSTQSYAAIISIGAVKFDLNTGKIGDTFYRNIDLQSALDSGLLVNSASILWWMNQNKKSIRDLQNDKVELYSALLDFAKFCSGDYYVWGNSAKFDLGILQS
jgi:exodeoxyribonuclease VIII